MSSKNIYTEQTTPYFYIIRHIKSGKLYAGSKWAKNCHPNLFMKYGGYTTSSPTVNSIIESEGLESFEILRIDTNLDGVSAYDYETAFLEINDCAGLDNWINGHNNLGMCWGTPEFYEKSKKTSLLKYGYNNPTKSTIVKEKIKSTNSIKYGGHPLQNTEVKEKSRNTCMEKYNYEFVLQVPEFRKKSILKILEIYGVDNVSKNEIIKKQKSDTCLINYGVDNPSKSDIIKKKKSDRARKIYGVDNISQAPEIKQRKKDTALEKWGVEHTLLSPIIKEQIRQTNLKKYGYDNPSKRPFFSIIETKKTYGKNTLSKYYPELKQYY